MRKRIRMSEIRGFRISTFIQLCDSRKDKGEFMNNLTKTVFASVMLALFFSGCGVKEGAEFYALQKQDNRLADTVSNLQVQVNELMVANNGLRTELATNSRAVSLLIQDERRQEINFQKLLKQASKNSANGQTPERK